MEKDKPIIKIKPCEYRSYDKHFGACCLRYVANGNGNLEQCDYCNTDWEQQVLDYNKAKAVQNVR